ncbi:MAG: hypothetical protein IJY56_03580 [Clostridia bacterium]|nr:hypothetical protein [Clostridia bacterium]
MENETIWGCVEGLWVVLVDKNREKHRVVRKIIGAVIGVTARKENYYGKKQENQVSVLGDTQNDGNRQGNVQRR